MNKINFKISKEWFFVIIWSALVILTANIPYIYGYAIQTSQKIFMGDARCFIDTNTYLAWMHQAKDGNFLFKNLYTTEPQIRIFFHPLFLVLGNVARFTGLSLIFVHALSRIAFGFTLLLLCYAFISYFLQDSFARWLAFALTSVGGGFGWLAFFPAISKIPESWFITGWIEQNTFLSIYALPLFSFSLILLVLTFYFALKASESGTMKFAVYGGITALFLIWTHYFDYLIVFPILFVFFVCKYFVYQREAESLMDLKVFLTIFLISLPAVVYDLVAARINPIFFQHTWKEAVTLSPNFSWYLGGLGFIGIFALVGIFNFISGKMEEKKFNKFLFLSVWSVSVAFLIYFPIPFQRRLVEGVHIPLSILAAFGFLWLIEKLRWNRKIASAILILLVIPNIFIVFGRDMNHLKQNVSRQSVAGFLDKDIYIAIKWLESNTKREDIVLADYEIGNYIPALSGNTVFIGHSPQTLNFWDKWALVKKFFDESSSDEFRKEFLKTSGINYIIYSWKEKKIGEFNPKKVDYLIPVYRNPIVVIYKVIL